ncbi:MAG: cytochrome c [Pseudomonadota bacterium]
MIKSQQIKLLLISISLILILVFSVIWFGFYNVSAKDKHFALTTHLLELVRTRSIDARTSDIKVPDLTDHELIKAGAKNYAEMCTTCHLAPGMEMTEINQGLYPRPPVFSDKDYQNSPAAQFWVIKNGLKMTGMPAWSPPHTDEQVWAMVAFINKSKQLTATQYQQLIIKTAGEHNDDGHKH